MKKILLIGGTRYVGRELVAQRLAMGDEITVISRGNERPSWFNNVRHIACDREDLIHHQQRLAPYYDVVVDTQAYRLSHVQSLFAILSHGIGHYVLISSTSAYNFGESRFPDDYSLQEEDVDLTRWRTVGATANYAEGKRDCEKFLIEQTEVSYTIVRPPKIFGPDDPTGRIAWWLQQVQHHNPLAIPKRYRHSFQFVYIKDLVWCLNAALDSPATKNQIFNVAGAERLNIETWIAALNQACATQAQWQWVDDNTLELPLYNYRPYLFDITKVITALSFTPTPLRDWLRETAGWYHDGVM